MCLDMENLIRVGVSGSISCSPDIRDNSFKHMVKINNFTMKNFLQQLISILL
ncbi:hypothetical protein N499_1085 [Wolbachia pipientis wVitA]|nr:hypothetical protein N499_1085 [Wolbachia pipientis wVitA]